MSFRDRIPAVAHSVFHADSLAAEIATRYEIGTPTKSIFLQQGQNDTYLVHTDTGQFIIRVYRAGLRSLTDITYELALIGHLADSGVRVSVPLTRRSGGVVDSVAAHEGPRHVVVFTYAPGRLPGVYAPGFESVRAEEQVRLYGQAVASLHTAADSFASEFARPAVDLGYLTDRPVRLLRPLFARPTDDWDWIELLVQRLVVRLSHFAAAGLNWGACHGDLNGLNAHITEDGAITFYDFDECGPGWRAYDLAVFQWVLKRQSPPNAERLWSSYLSGYQSNRQLAATDLAAIPLFVMLRQLWWMAVQTEQGTSRGFGVLNERYIAWGRTMLQEWEQEDLST